MTNSRTDRPSTGARALSLTLVILALPLVIGCGGGIEAASRTILPEGRSEIQMVGVIRVSPSGLDDFRPRRLEVETQASQLDADIQRLLDAVLPGGAVRERGSGGVQWVVEPPPGLSLEDASSMLLQDDRVSAAHPQLLPRSSAGATLYQTSMGDFVVDGPALVGLTARQRGLLEAHNLNSIVRITGVVDLEALPLGPEDTVEVEEIEVLAPNLLDLEGRVWHMGDANDCVLMAMQDGRVVELVGAKVDKIRALSWSHGAWIFARGTDAGRSARSCSGGRRLSLTTFTLAKRE